MGILDNFLGGSQSGGQLSPVNSGLLAAGLGILANNRGLTSGTQAVGLGGLTGLQAYQSAQQQQQQRQLQNAQLQQLGFALKRNQLLYNTAANLLGDGQQPATAQAPAGATDAGGVAAGSGASGAGMQPAALQPNTGTAQNPFVQPQPAAPQPAQGGRSPLFGNIPNNLAGFGLLTDPNKLFEIAAGQYAPTDLQKTLRAAGIDPSSAEGQQILRQNIEKTNRIAPTALRPGGAYIGSDGQLHSTPAAAPAGFENVPQPDGSWRTIPVQGGTDAIRSSSAAQAGGKAQYQLQQVWDQSANGGKGGFVQQTVANVSDAAAGAPGAGPANLPAPLRANNPGALMPGGRLAQYPDQQSGLAALDGNLASYGKQGINTVAGVISKWAPPNENDTQAYIADVSQRLGLKPNQPIDLSQPVVRHALGSAIMLHENGSQGVFGYPGAQGTPGAAPAPAAVQAVGGPMASQPPLGMTNAASASQGAPSKLMADSYGGLSSADANYQQSREALTEMMALAGNKGTSGTAVGLLPSSVGTKISPDAAKYQKLHATYVALQGKALGSGGTDAARATIDEAVPTYDKPQSAMTSGLATQLNNLDLAHLKTQFLTPIYQQGDEKAFTQQSAAFDQNIKPTMIPALQLSGDQQRAAVQAAVKANPSLRSNFEWAFNNGLLK